jgi:hypothetical protein
MSGSVEDRQRRSVLIGVVATGVISVAVGLGLAYLVATLHSMARATTAHVDQAQRLVSGSGGETTRVELLRDALERDSEALGRVTQAFRDLAGVLGAVVLLLFSVAVLQVLVYWHLRRLLRSRPSYGSR